MLHPWKIFFCCLVFFSQQADAAPAQYAFRITFTDKSGAPAISATSSWLSARALARRAAFGIALDSTDRPVSPRYIDSVLSLTGGKLHNTSRWLNQCVVLLTDSSKITGLAGRNWIGSIAWVGYFASGLHKSAPSGGINPKSEATYALPGISTGKTTGSPAYYGSAYGQVALVHGDSLHDQGYRGQGKLIAVLDEGFTEVNTHPGFDSMRQSGRLLETYNFVRDTPFVYGYGTHGTSCLSTMAGIVPGKYAGTAPDAMYALYVTEDGSFTDAIYELDNLVAGLERADSIGADVISCSLGYNIFTSPYYSVLNKADLNGHTTIVARAANMASAKGIIFTVSAGNEGANSWAYIVTPADADSALTVGAVTSSGGPVGFSSPGPNASGRIKPDVCLQGEATALFVGGNAIGTSGGTSFAAPQAAGYAACLLQAFPSLQPALIRIAIDSSAHLARNPTPKLGYGIPDFRWAQQFLGRFVPPAPGGVRVFPNPFGKDFSVILPTAASAADIRVYDVSGRQVTIQQNRVAGFVSVTPTGSMPAGIYMVSIVADGQRYVHKLVHF